jgi:hypothetical protein
MSANIFNESRNWLVNAANIASVNGNVSVAGNLVTSNVTGYAGQSSLVTISGNLIIPSGTTNANLGAGQLRYNPTLLTLQFYNGSAWSVVGSSYGVATQTGGTSSTITDTNSYTLLQWTNTSGTKTLIVSTAGLFDMLLVGGGGGGGGGPSPPYGGEGGGGGGAGQVIVETLYLPVGTYDVSIGLGGAESLAGSINFAGASGINLQPLASAGTLKYEALGGVSGGSAWSGGQKGYNASGASYRSGYGGNPSVASFALFGKAGGASDGGGNNGGGGGSTGAGSTRSSTTPATAILGGGGTGLTTTFTGTSVIYGVGGCAGGSSGSVPTAPPANTGNGGAGAIYTGSGQSGASGFVAVRFRI